MKNKKLNQLRKWLLEEEDIYYKIASYHLKMAATNKSRKKTYSHHQKRAISFDAAASAYSRALCYLDMTLEE